MVLDHWFKPITPTEAAPGFHQFLTEKEYRKRIDLSDKAANSYGNTMKTKLVD